MLAGSNFIIQCIRIRFRALSSEKKHAGPLSEMAFFLSPRASFFIIPPWRKPISLAESLKENSHKHAERYHDRQLSQARRVKRIYGVGKLPRSLESTVPASLSISEANGLFSNTHAIAYIQGGKWVFYASRNLQGPISSTCLPPIVSSVSSEGRFKLFGFPLATWNAA